MENKITETKKREILEKVKSGNISIRIVADEYNISTKTIYRWIKEDSETTPSFWEIRKLKQENKALKELIGAITYEMEKTKKRGS